jgi:hypothetical protein
VRATAEELRLAVLGAVAGRAVTRLTRRVEGRARPLKGAAAPADDRDVRRAAQLQEDTWEGT